MNVIVGKNNHVFSFSSDFALDSKELTTFDQSGNIAGIQQLDKIEEVIVDGQTVYPTKAMKRDAILEVMRAAYGTGSLGQRLEKYESGEEAK